MAIHSDLNGPTKNTSRPAKNNTSYSYADRKKYVLALGRQRWKNEKGNSFVIKGLMLREKVLSRFVFKLGNIRKQQLKFKKMLIYASYARFPKWYIMHNSFYYYSCKIKCKL